MSEEKFVKLLRKLFLIAVLGFIVTVFIIPCLASLIFFALFFFSPPQLFVQSSSPNGKYSLSAKTRGAFLYGSHDIKIYQSENNRGEKQILDTSIRNDGANLTDNNVSFEWVNNYQALLKLDGQEQEPVCYLIKVGEKPSHIQKDCPFLEKSSRNHRY